MIEVELNSQDLLSTDDLISVLSGYNSIMPIYLDLDRILYIIADLTIQIRKYEDKLLQLVSPTVTVTFSNGYDSKYIKSVVAEYIHKRVPSEFLVYTKTMTISMSKEALTETITGLGKDYPEEVDVIRTYLDWNSAVYNKRTMLGYLTYPSVNDKLSIENHRMLRCMPTWAPQNSGRVGMTNPAIQNIKREYQNIVTCPAGYNLIHADSGQIEPRIVYSWIIKDPQIQTLINLYDDSYYGVLHYCTMPEEDITSGRLDFTPMEITPELKEKRKKIKTYTNAVMYGSTSNAEADPIKDAMIQRIGKHPMRLSFCKTLEEQIDRGVRKFPTAFGRLIDISNSKKLVGESNEDAVGSLEDFLNNKNAGYKSSDRYQLLKLAINNPIQGTAADFMNKSVQYVQHLLLERNCIRSSIACYIHDAGVFYVHDDDMDKIGDELKDVVAYHVNGWLPIHAEAEVNSFSGVAQEFAY